MKTELKSRPKCIYSPSLSLNRVNRAGAHYTSAGGASSQKLPISLLQGALGRPCLPLGRGLAIMATIVGTVPVVPAVCTLYTK